MLGIWQGNFLDERYQTGTFSFLNFLLLHAIMYSFNQHLLSTYSVPGTLKIIANTSVSKRDINPGLQGASIPAGKDIHNNKHNEKAHYIVC